VRAVGSLYVDAGVDEIRADGRTLTLYRAGRLEGRVPVVPLERVVIAGNVRLEARVLHLLAGQGVAVHFVSARQGRWKAGVYGPEHGHVHLRVAQVQAHLDPARCTALARRFVARKIERQIENLHAWLASGPADRKPLADARSGLAAALERVPGADLETLRGLEGASARAYFQAMAAVLPAGLGFSGRNRRPPRDPVNALLSLAYTLVHAEWAGLLRTAGLDPAVGFLHALEYGRESLACDLVEPQRPRVDRWAVDLFRRGVFRGGDFSRSGGRAGCWLRPAARQRFYPEYETWAEALRPGWRRECYALAAELMGEVQHAQPVPGGE